MSESQRIRLRDMRGVANLMDEIRGVGRNPSAWRLRLLEGGMRLLHADVAMTMEMANALPGAMPRLIEPLTAGWQDAAEEARYYQYFTNDEVAEDPGADAIFGAHTRSPFASGRRCDWIDDRTWYASSAVSMARKESHVDDFVFASFMPAPGILQGAIFYRRWGEKPFSQRELRLARLIYLSLLRMIRQTQERRQALAEEYHLSPRLLQTLDHLAGPLGFKQIADDIGVTSHTLNGYIKLLYARMGVRSRAELIDRWRLRCPTPVVLPSEFSSRLIC